MGRFGWVVLLQGIVLFVECLLYFLIAKHSASPRYVDSRLDRKLPLLTVFVYPYGLWYVLIAAFPPVLYLFSPERYRAYMLCLFVILGVSFGVYWFFPTAVHRPEVPGNRLSARLLRLIYQADREAKNCLPSLHCSLSFLYLLAAFSCGGLPAALQWGVGLLSLLVVASTLFTRQHALIDVGTALLLTLGVWFAFGLPG